MGSAPDPAEVCLEGTEPAAKDRFLGFLTTSSSSPPGHRLPTAQMDEPQNVQAESEAGPKMTTHCVQDPSETVLGTHCVRDPS